MIQRLEHAQWKLRLLIGKKIIVTNDMKVKQTAKIIIGFLLLILSDIAPRLGQPIP